MSSIRPKKAVASRLGLPTGLTVGLLLLHILPFAVRPALIGGDEPHYALMAHSVAIDGDFDLRDDYQEVAHGSAAASKKRAGQELDHHFLRVGDREVFGHPLGLPVLVAPLVWLQQTLAPGSAPDLLLGLFALALAFTALIAGWRLAWRWTDDSRIAALAVFGAYFSSPLWFYSRTFFTEPFTWSFAVLAVAAVASGHIALAAVFLALTLAMKETALLLVGVIVVGVAWRRGVATAGRLLLGPAVFAVVFMIKNVLLLGEPLATFHPYRVGSFWEGARGLLVDPERGLLWFAPLLFVGSFAAWWKMPRAHRVPSLLAAFAFASYFVVSAAWIDWRGGSGYGPRLLVPGLVALAVPVTSLLASLHSTRNHAALLLPGGLFVAGFTVQWCAAVDPVPAFWSISVGDLLSGPLWRTATGVLLGAVLARLLWRRTPSQPYPKPAKANPSPSA